jgi:hypothetical protein
MVSHPAMKNKLRTTKTTTKENKHFSTPISHVFGRKGTNIFRQFLSAKELQISRFGFFYQRVLYRRNW